MGRAAELAGKAMGKVKSAKQALTGGVGVFQRLAEDHGRVATLMRRVALSGEGSPARTELFAKIRAELLAHARAEEKEVYSVFRTIPGVGDAIDERVQEHAAIERLLDQLDHMSTADERWTDVFRELTREVHRHVEHEEHVIFPRAKDALTRARSEGLAERFEHAKALELAAMRPA